ncbi:hypothetical protein A2W14_05085 [Candidatus Gottesmanbacteria bacterium RBG_16_37_8]|uniref:Soluble ligand binding domain-containing protein n=1 Tax=Candidatus Gottesmanbacteria bacterium RBG_16_37_8 TaxID=1798371 RepID=A0A1F5YUH7_9BACT|nr:MAG: hypothetical protein A2W14_05085 [Candidatus Gottesmanbacteria bacterium RBG_16_37_8]
MAEIDDLPLVNLEKISSLISFYKFPLVLACIGVVLAVISVIILTKPASDNGKVVFSTEATGSAKLDGGRIKVDVEGSVNKPGVYEFDEEERVSDAIESAGGLTEKADLTWMEKNLNKAAKLIDGGKIYIPAKGESGIQSSVVSSQKSGNVIGVTTGLININSASQTELEILPGVGPVTAGKIIDGRPYGAIEELKTKKIVGNSLYDKIKEKLTI